MDPNITSAVRDIFVIVAAGAFTVLCLIAVFVVVRLYRPLRESAKSASAAADSLRRVTTDLAAVSEETAMNIAQTARNAVTISQNLKEGSEDLNVTVRTATEAASNVAEAASSVGMIADTVMRFSSLGVSGGGTSSGVGTLLRLLRNVFGGGRRSDDGGPQPGG